MTTGVALVTKRDAREIRWVANWASLATDLLLDPSVARMIREQLARPDVQEAIRQCESRLPSNQIPKE
jgi:hypothetical protein